jgi:flagellar biosynthesis/type III secretory pathway protein FliH
LSNFVPFGGGGAAGPPTGFGPLPTVVDEVEPPPPPAFDERAAEQADEARRAFQAGYELGREELLSQVEQVAESFVKSLEELAAFRSALRERYERELLALVFAVARRILHHELAEHPERWLELIRAGVDRLVERDQIVVRVPARLAAYLREHLSALRAALDGVKGVELVEDPALAAHGCIIESRFGEADVGVETQLQNVTEALATGPGEPA